MQLDDPLDLAEHLSHRKAESLGVLHQQEQGRITGIPCLSFDTGHIVRKISDLPLIHILAEHGPGDVAL